MFQLEIAGCSDLGTVRRRNEDAWFGGTLASRPGKRAAHAVIDDAGRTALLAVCDGLGGHNVGEEASRLAIATLPTALKAQPFSAAALLTAIRGTDRVVTRAARSRAEWHGMGTTLTCAWLADSLCRWGQVGDSRLYLLRDGELRQMTPEHSLVGRLRRAGELNEEEARTHPLHSRIDQCLGGDAEDFAPDVGEFPLADQDVLLLCSDGVVDGLLDADIRALLCAGRLDAAHAIARNLVHEAVRRSGRDNTTAVIARVTAQESGAGSKRKTFFSRVPFFARSLNNSDS